MVRTEYRVIPSSREGIRDSEGPAVLAHVRAHNSDIDDVLQTLKDTRDKRAMCPGTSVGDVEVVPPCPNTSVPLN